jgi:hypothetical protein
MESDAGAAAGAEAKDHVRAPAPGSQARRAGLRLVVAHTLAKENASTRVLTRCGVRAVHGHSGAIARGAESAIS